MIDFFRLIYQHTPEPTKQLIAWGAVTDPLYLTVDELLSGDWVANVPPDRDWYFTPAVLADQRRVKANVAGSSVVWIDRDSYKDTTQPILPPTARVTSGRGEHLYYVLDNFYSVGDIEQVNKKLLAHVGLPKEGTWDATRVLRVPGTNNCKYLHPEKYPDYKEPLPCEMLEFNPQYVYSLTDLARLMTFPPDLLSTPRKEDGILDRSRCDWQIGLRLRDWGVSRYAVRYALEYHSDKADERPDDYVERTLDKLFENQEKPGNDGDEGDDELSLINAELEPTARLIDANGMEIGMVIRVAWDKRQVLAYADASDFLSAQRVIRWLQRSGAGNRTFIGSDKAAKLLYTLLVQKIPDKAMVLVEHAGRYDLPDGTRLFIYNTDKALCYPKDADYGVFMKPQISGLENSYLQLDPTSPDPDETATLLSLVQQVQLPSVMQPALGWLVMTPFNSVIWNDMRLPIPTLLLFGFPGSGKTTLAGSVLLPLLGCFTQGTASDGTKFSAIGHMSLTHSWPVWFGEFRMTNFNSQTFMAQLRKSYDHIQETRGRPDQSVVSYQLTAPVLLDGESAFGDGANAERTISLRLSKDTVDVGSDYQRAFTALVDLPSYVWHRFAYDYLQWTLGKDGDYLKDKLQEGLRLFRLSAPSDRVMKNMAIAWAGLTVLADYTQERGYRVDIRQEITEFTTALGFVTNTDLGIRTEADNLVELIAGFTDNPHLGAWYDDKADILWFSLVKAHKIFSVRMDMQSLQLQLEERRSKYIVGPSRHNDGGLWWGIQVQKAQDVGLVAPRPVVSIQLERGVQGLLANTNHKDG